MPSISVFYVQSTGWQLLLKTVIWKQCMWSRGNSSHHRISSYTHTRLVMLLTHSAVCLTNHSFCSKAWNHSPDPLRQETDSQAYSQNLSRTQAQSAHYWLRFSPTFIFPRLGIGRASVMAQHVHTGSDRWAHRETNTQKTDSYKQLITESADYMFTWAEQYACMWCIDLSVPRRSFRDTPESSGVSQRGHVWPCSLILIQYYK